MEVICMEEDEKARRGQLLPALPFWAIPTRMPTKKPTNLILDSKKPALLRAFTRLCGAEGETRTLTMLPSADFESAASTIPPLRL